MRAHIHIINIAKFTVQLLLHKWGIEESKFFYFTDMKTFNNWKLFIAFIVINCFQYDFKISDKLQNLFNLKIKS